MQLGAAYLYALGIPERRTAFVGQLAVMYSEPTVMPEGVAEVEKAVLGLYVAALLEGALPVGRAFTITPLRP